MKGASLSQRLIAASLVFLMMPVNIQQSRTTGHLAWSSTEARADNFQSLGDQLGGQQVQDFALFCNYVDKINAVAAVLRQVAAVQSFLTAGTAAALISQAESVPQMCNVVMAILSAKNLDGVLRAARAANRAYIKSDTVALDMIEDSVDLAISIDNFGKSKESPLDKALNAGMYARVLNYAFKYTPLERSSSRVKETATVASRQTQLIADMKMNNECMEPSAYEKGLKEKELAKKKDVTTLPNGLEIKQSDMRRILSRQEKAYRVLNGSAADNIKTIAQSLMTMIQTVETRGTDALEVSGAIIRRLVDSEKPYPAVGYDATKVVPRTLEKKDGEIRYVDNDFCRRASTDENDPTAKAQMEQELQRKCMPFKEKVDMTKAYYRKSESGRISACSAVNKSKNKLELWEANNISVLADSGFDPRTLSTVSQVCGDGSFDGIRIDYLLTGLEKAHANAGTATLYTDEDAELFEKDRQKKIQDNCVEGASQQALKRFNSISGFGPSADNAFAADWSSQVGCDAPSAETLARTRTDADPVKYQKFSQDFSTVKKWRDHYNDKLNGYIENKYKGLEDSSAASWIRGTKKTENNLAPKDESYGRANAWSDGKKSWNDPLRKIRALQGELGIVSLCQLPSYLKRKYPDRKDFIDGFDGAADAREMMILQQRCRNETEGNVGEYTDIFSTFVTALYDEKIELAQARADVFDADVMLGSYIGVAGVRKTNECGSIQSAERSAVLANNLSGMILATALEARQRDIERDMEKTEHDRAIEKANDVLRQEIARRGREKDRHTKPSALKNDHSTSKLYPSGNPTQDALKYVDPKYVPDSFRGAKP